MQVVEGEAGVILSREDIGLLRATWVEAALSKERLRQLRRMQRLEVGTNAIESFLGSLEGVTWAKVGQGKLERGILNLAMKKKILDEKEKLKHLKVRKEKLRESLRIALREKKRKYKKIMMKINE